MTSEQYAEMVRVLVMDVRNTGVRDAAESPQLEYAFSVLARRSGDRCLGVGRDNYERDDGTQAFEDRDLLEILEDCREEALDVPAYLTQVDHRLSILTDSAAVDPDVAEGVVLAARLLLVLDRLEMRVGEME